MHYEKGKLEGSEFYYHDNGKEQVSGTNKDGEPVGRMEGILSFR